MTTVVTEMLPSMMEITSKGKHTTIQTSKPRLTGNGAMLKTDDASDISVSLTLFAQLPSVYLKTKGKRVILRVSYLMGLPVGFRNNILVGSLLLSNLIEKDDETGMSRLKNKWLLTILLLSILREVEEFFNDWGIPAPDFERLQDAFDDGDDDRKQYNAIVFFLQFYGPTESLSEKTHFDMIAELVELSHSLCKELHWQVFIRGEVAAALRAAFSKSPFLTNEINLYHLPYVELPTELAAKVEEAVEAQIKSLDLSTLTKDRMNKLEEAVLETVSEKYLMLKASDTGPPIGILHRNCKGAAIISPLMVRITVRSATSRMMDGIRSGFA
jgi:hypothetical protein